VVAGVRASAVLPILLMGCAPGAIETASQPEPAFGTPFEISGIYNYVDGDRLTPSGCRSDKCTETVVRDDRFQRDLIRLQGKRLYLLVRRIQCPQKLVTMACLRTLNGTVLTIDKWLGQ